MDGYTFDVRDARATACLLFAHLCIPLILVKIFEILLIKQMLATQGLWQQHGIATIGLQLLAHPPYINTNSPAQPFHTQLITNSSRECTFIHVRSLQREAGKILLARLFFFFYQVNMWLPGLLLLLLHAQSMWASIFFLNYCSLLHSSLSFYCYSSQFTFGGILLLTLVIKLAN